eukprot:GHVN01034967.1.p1 GENE.GHVN01034967.1~~GHVN01034967.1.p1  ORF type:complete len:452 (+),score=64.12 GHVN01034967.1:906-2261(+)
MQTSSSAPPYAVAVPARFSTQSINITSWNLWGIPYWSVNYISRTGSLGPRALSAFNRLTYEEAAASYAVSKATAASPSQPASPQSPPPPTLKVMCFCEVWAYRVGLSRPLFSLVRYMERRYACCRRKETNQRVGATLLTRTSIGALVVTAVGALVGWMIPISCWPFLWDPKEEICRSLREGASDDDEVGNAQQRSKGCEDEMKYSVGCGGKSMGRWFEFWKMMDSGLLIVLNAEVSASGFIPYIDHGVELAANKGFLWAVTYGVADKTQDVTSEGTPSLPTLYLIVASHLCAASTYVRVKNVHQLTRGIINLQHKFSTNPPPHPALKSDSTKPSQDSTNSNNLTTPKITLRTFLCGDLNISKTSEEYTLLSNLCDEVGMQAVTSNRLSGTSVGTYPYCMDNTSHPVEFDGNRREIDYIFASTGAVHEPKENNVAWRSCSDHAMVGARVRWE